MKESFSFKHRDFRHCGAQYGCIKLGYQKGMVINMAKYDGILLCSDFDGTLFCGDSVSDENSRAIKYFQENGGLFTIITGRFPESLARYYDRFMPNTYVAGLNGAVIFDPMTGRCVYSGEMPEGAQRFAERIFLENSEITKIGFHSFDTYYPFTRISWQEDIKIDGLTKIIFIVDEEDSQRMSEKIRDLADPGIYSVARSWSTCVELLNKENTKGRAVRRLTRLLGSRVEKLICVGDHENDISMILEADIGYAVANATELAKNAADRITVSNQDHAIAHIISEL